MAGETTPSRNPAGHVGLVDNLLALTGALSGYFEARAAVVASDSKTALRRLLVIAACIVVAVSFFVFGYLLLLAAVVFGIALLANASWILIAFLAAAVHFVFALFLMVIAQAKMKTPLFRATIEELRKDREWLENLDQTTRN